MFDQLDMVRHQELEIGVGMLTVVLVLTVTLFVVAGL
jgi:hypothetical protein